MKVLDTYAAARRALERDETSCESLVLSFLDRINRENPRLNAFISISAESAIARARELDEERAGGMWRPLTGMVVGVKDVICTTQSDTTCGSRMLEGFRSLYDATVVRKLAEAGAIVVGKLNCDEFAMGSSNETSHFGPVRNPIHDDYVPGGSSGGSAAAVAAGLCHVALGTDTGGSIRQPAALCGVVGLKPTYGRVSRLGLVAYASSFDCIGPLANSVGDAARVLGVIAGRDPWDATSAPVDVPDYSLDMARAVEGLRIGLPREYFADGLDAGVREQIEDSVESLRLSGATVVDVSLPHTAYGIATYYVLATAEASSNLARYDGVRYGHRASGESIRRSLAEGRERLQLALEAAEKAGNVAEAEGLQAELAEQGSLLDGLYGQTRSEGFGDEVKRRIMLGTYVLSSGYYDAYYRKAQQARTLIRQDFDQAFGDVDVLLTPATPTPAFRIGSKIDDPIEMYLSDIYTVTANLAGIPGLVVPIGRHADPPHLPVGLQLLAPHFDEGRLLQVGEAVMMAGAKKNP